MKKNYSLIKACMTSDMSLFKIKTNSKNKSAILIPLFIALYLMFMIWGSANSIFEKLQQTNLEYVILSFLIISVSFMTFIEGIYKSGSLMFNCRDDQLLLSLPIKKETILFIRIFKFYCFELLFNALFILPVMLAYIRWNPNFNWTYILSCLVMLIFLPIIPIVLSCFVGAFTTGLSSKFKYKNLIQIILSMLVLIGILYVSFNISGIFNYIINNATNINDLITKIYYPAGIFTKLVIDFNFLDLFIFIIINLIIFVISIYILSKFYFKINSRIKSITYNKKINVNKLIIKVDSPIKSLVKKEIKTFFNIPVFIINAGFALVLFIIAIIIIVIKFDSVLSFLISSESGLGLTQELIFNNISILILSLITITSYMTSITNSVISLEGRNINILKSLPIKTNKILLSKILAASLITTPILILGDIIMFIKFKINIIEAILLIILSILIPLVSHFIGIIINLKYPKLDWENTAEVVKQSISSFIAVMIGMILMIISIAIIIVLIRNINSISLLLIMTILYIIIDIILYYSLINKGIKRFNGLVI